MYLSAFRFWLYFLVATTSSNSLSYMISAGSGPVSYFCFLHCQLLTFSPSHRIITCLSPKLWYPYLSPRQHFWCLSLHITHNDNIIAKMFWALCFCLIMKSCPTHCDPMDYSPPGSSVQGNLSPGKNTRLGCHFLLCGIFLTRDWSHVSCLSGRFFTTEHLLCAERMSALKLSHIILTNAL